MKAWLVATHIPTQKVEWFPLPEDPVPVGRRCSERGEGKIEVSVDPSLSRMHFEIGMEGLGARVRLHPQARRRLYLQGLPLDEFSLTPGNHFSTCESRFQLLLEPPTPLQEDTYQLPSEEVAGARRLDEARCLAALLRLHDELCAGAEGEGLLPRLAPLLAELVPGASTVLVVQVGPEGALQVRAAAGRGSAPQGVSRTLLQRAFEAGRPVVHMAAEPQGDGTSTEVRDLSAPTVFEGVLWSLVAPLSDRQPQRLALYALGTEARESEPGRLDRAVLALAADMVSRHLEQTRLNRLEGQLSRFFSPRLRDLIQEDPSHPMLRLREREVTSLFFDLRGYSRGVEKAETAESRFLERAEILLRHHDRVREIMTEATRCIFEADGIVLGFRGDGIFACWGFPDGGEDHPVRALEASRSIARSLRSLGTLGAEVRFGIGLSTGPALIGDTGFAGQHHFDALGRSVNIAARLQSLTKTFGVPVLATGGTREAAGEQGRFRRVGRVSPEGMESEVEVFEPILSEELGGTGISPEDVARYEEALAALEGGETERASGLLVHLQPRDPVSRALARCLAEGRIGPGGSLGF